MIENPIWKSLSTGHANLAIGNENVKRYPSRVAPFVALAEHTQDHLKELETIVEFDETVCLLGEVPSNHKWDILSSGQIAQMIYSREKLSGCEHTYRKMQILDVPAMMELTDLVFKGYFREGTIDMGRYIGIFGGTQLAAMAGQRFAPEGYREISAVCTHPDFQRRGLAATLVKCLIYLIQKDDETPFLHVNADSPARTLYEKMGFETSGFLDVHFIQKVSY